MTDDILVDACTKKIAKESAISFSCSFLGRLVGLGIQLTLTNVLGVASFGLYALGITIIELLQNFATLGLDTGVVKFGTLNYHGKTDRQNSKLKGVIVASLLIAFSASTLFAVLLIVFSYEIAVSVFKQPKLLPVIRILALSLPFYACLLISSAVFTVFRELKYNLGISVLLHRLLRLIATVVFFLMGLRLFGAVWAVVVANVFCLIASGYFLLKKLPTLFSKIEFGHQTGPLFNYSITIFALVFLFILFVRIDRLMIGYFLGMEKVGIYHVAANLSLQMGIFLSAFIGIFSSFVVEVHNNKQQKQLDQIYKTTTRWAFTLTLPLFLIMVSYPENIMALFGKDFVQGSQVLVILSISSFINISVGPTANLITMTGYQKIELANGICALLMNIFLNILLIKLYGIMGAAIATCISITAVQLIKLVQIKLLLKVFPYDMTFIKPLLIGVIIFLAINLVDNLPWLCSILLILFLYGALLLIFGLEDNDKAILAAVWKKLNLRGAWHE